MALLRNAIAAVAPQQVVVMPAGVPPHKRASVTPAVLRLAMCGCFEELFPELVVCEWEAYAPGKSYTADTVARLRGACPGAEVFLAVGGDMLLSFESWQRYR